MKLKQNNNLHKRRKGMKKLTLLIVLMAFSLSFVKTTIADDFSDAIVKTKKKFLEAADKNDNTALVKVRGDFERILQLKKNEWLVNYYLGITDLMLSYLAVDKNKDDIKKYTESSISLLDKSTDAKDDFSEAWILKMAVQSNRWMYEPDKMGDIISKQSEAKDKAKKLEPENPRFYLIDGTNVYYTPSNFGGGPDVALPIFQKSWDYFQTYKPKDETYPDWGKDRAAGMMALCYIQNDKLDDAKKWIDKGLEVSPDSKFIKEYVQKQYDEKAKK
jgi:hypothetical protein